MDEEREDTIRLVLGRVESGIEGEPAGGARRYAARFVQAGAVRSSGGRTAKIEVSHEALRLAHQGGLFENKAVFIDHPAGLVNPSLHDLVGVTRRAVFTGEAIEGEIELYNTPNALIIASLLDELLIQAREAPDIGLSLVFYPVWGEAAANGVRRVVDIQYIESIDLVFQPAAGGRLLQALAIGTQRNQIMENEEIQNLPSFDRLRTLNPDAAQDEALRQAQEAAQDWARALAASAAQAMIQASDLPQASRQRLAGAAYGSPQLVAQAIEAEQRYLASLSEAGVVKIGGIAPRASAITGMRDGLDRLELALDALLAGVRPPDGIQPLSGIREAYHLMSGDYEMSGVFQPERVAFANVDSATMAGMVANALNKRLVHEFAQYPQWWAPVVSIEDFTSLQTVRWITLGGVGELPTVAEGAAYTELNWDDQTETSSFVKKGGYLGITLEAIDKDDVGRLRAAPRALAQAAWLTLSKAIASLFTQSSGAGPTMSDSVALFHADHANLGSSALSVASFAATRTAMRKQTELNSLERLGALTAPRFLLVPPDLEITALQVLASEADYSYAVSNAPAAPVNPLAEGDTFQQRMNLARGRVIVVDLWTDTNDWAAAADPRLYPTIGLGFRYGRTPEIFSVASPTAGLMFSNDTMPVKARFFFAAGPTDWRGLYKQNVA